ncbi:MAG: hypothetical protein ACJAW2_001270 [Shewanella sp.]|jgi:hypothetical protein
MANSKAEQNLETFITWQTTLSDDCFKQMIFRGALNKVEIAKACNFGKSALQQNPQIKEALAKLEGSLRKRGILPKLTDKAKVEQSQPKQHDRTSRKAATDAKRIAQLEQEVLELKARLKRYGDLSEVLLEMGMGV